MRTHFLDIDNVAYNLRLRKSGDKYHGACPICGYASGFELTTGENRRILGYCHANRCDMKDFFRGLYMGEPVATSRGVHRRIRCTDHHVKHNSEYAIEDMWYVQSFPPEGTVVEKYLHSRGLTGIIPPSIRLLSGAVHKESHQSFPVMMAGVNRVGLKGIIGLHRTFLKPDGSGKADVEPNKKSLGAIRGGGVFLGNPGEIVGVSEGIENGLTFQQATGIPTIAALSTGGMKDLILPQKPMAATVYIVADNDPPGQEAANAAADRWSVEGRHVIVITPPEPKSDLNDLLMRSLGIKGEF